jgi:predicted TPR repeat methyltransferase
MSPLSSLFLSSGDSALDRRHAWARGLVERGEAAAAIELLSETLKRAPQFLAGWFLLGEAQEEAGDRKAAVRSFRRALTLDPSDRLGAGLRLARLGERDEVRAMSSAYVQTLFDQYAARFDRELVESLYYDAPAQLRAALDRTASGRRFARVLDLGCGTGLMGAAIRDCADELIGVDLSKKMIEAAGRKEIYDRLITGDLVECLAAEPNAFDLILAADVFAYVADLKPVFAAAANRLSPDGYFAFTIETHDGDDVILGPSLRFAHGEEYLVTAAKTAGLKSVLMEPALVRRERNIPVEGALAILARSERSLAAE